MERERDMKEWGDPQSPPKLHGRAEKPPVQKRKDLNKGNYVPTFGVILQRCPQLALGSDPAAFWE